MECLVLKQEFESRFEQFFMLVNSKNISVTRDGNISTTNIIFGMILAQYFWHNIPPIVQTRVRPLEIINTGTQTLSWIASRNKSFWLLFSPIFLSGNSFEISIFCSKLSYIASYLKVTLYTLCTLTTHTHHGQLYSQTDYQLVIQLCGISKC